MHGRVGFSTKILSPIFELRHRRKIRDTGIASCIKVKLCGTESTNSATLQRKGAFKAKLFVRRRIDLPREPHHFDTTHNLFFVGEFLMLYRLPGGEGG